MKTMITIEHGDMAPETVKEWISGADPRDTYKKIQKFFEGLACGSRSAKVDLSFDGASVAKPAPKKETVVEKVKKKVTKKK
jgi:hypothetical protein